MGKNCLLQAKIPLSWWNLNQLKAMILSKSTKPHHFFRLTFFQQYKTFPFEKPKTKPSYPKKGHKTSSRKRKDSPPFVTNVKEARDPDEALSLFHEYLQMGIKPEYPSYSALIYKLARCQDFEAVEEVLGYVQDNNVHFQETLFVALFQHYGKAHLVDKAIELFHRMTCFNCVRTSQSLNGLLNVLVDNDRFLEANELFDKAYKMGFRLNSVAFNVMIKGWLERGEWDQACKVFEEMLERKVEPSVVTYNSLIGYLCRNGELDKANGLLEDMIKKGKRPNAVTYALLMKGLCSIGEHNEAKKMMFDMEYRGCKPTVVNFGVLMSDLGKRGKIEEAKTLLHEMKRRHFKPDVVTYNILINYFCKEGRAAEAYKVFFEMQIAGCEANAATYRMLVDGFCRVDDFEGGLKVLNAMLTSGHSPRVETFRCLVIGLVKSGNLYGACFVLEEMEKRQMTFCSDDWEALVMEYRCGVESISEHVNELILAMEPSLGDEKIV